MTPALLRQAMPFTSADLALVHAQPLTNAMEKWGITTPTRKAAFLANVAAETSSLRQLKELSDGSAYEGHADLGNTEPGWGALYIGRGDLMVTGHAMYLACATALNLPLVLHPELLEQPANAAQCAGWVWSMKGCNEYADKVPTQFPAVCHRINGGYVGIDERVDCWLYARRAFSLTP